MAPVVPDLYFYMGWTYSRRPCNPYIAPSGTMTIAADGHQVPCCADREVFLYLCARAHGVHEPDRTVLVDLKELSQWLGARRRMRRTRQHLDRVMNCRILRGSAGNRARREISIGRWASMDYRYCQVVFTPEFIEECTSGIPYSVEVASLLRAQPAYLDLYLALLGFVHDIREYDEFTHEYRTCETIPLPAGLYGARRLLVQRLDGLRGVLPGAHASLAPSGTGILIDIGQPKRTSYAGGSPQTFQQRQRFARMIRTMPPEERRRFGMAVDILAAYARRLEEPTPWQDMWQAIERAEAQTNHAMESLEQHGAHLRSLLVHPSEPEHR